VFPLVVDAETATTIAGLLVVIRHRNAIVVGEMESTP
jgi:hypothetical protein